MGKKGKWFSNVKKAFSPDSKKSKHKLPQYQNGAIPDPVSVETFKPSPPPLETKVDEVIVEQDKNMCSPPAGVAIAPVADIPEVSSQTVSEVVHYAAAPRFAGKSKEEAAAIMIQTTFRGYLARRAVRAMRGLVRLKSLLEGCAVKRQAANTLKCMQTLSRVQSQIRARRIKMSEENQARQKLLLQKHAKELANYKNGEDWDDSLQSKEQVEASLMSKYQAAMRRERALAYSHSHQQSWKNNTRYANSMAFMDASNPAWGWSWLERWMAACPWERSDKENDNSSVKNSEVTKSAVRPRKNNFVSPPTPSFLSRKSRASMSPSMVPDDDAKSTVSMQSRRHSIAGSYVRDDESLSSSPSLPSYMVPTKSARAKLKPQSPLAMASDENSVVEATSVKKRLSYTGPPKPRRLSAPPKVESGGLSSKIAV